MSFFEPWDVSSNKKRHLRLELKKTITLYQNVLFWTLSFVFKFWLVILCYLTKYRGFHEELSYKLAANNDYWLNMVTKQPIPSNNKTLLISLSMRLSCFQNILLGNVFEHIFKDWIYWNWTNKRYLESPSKYYLHVVCSYINFIFCFLTFHVVLHSFTSGY